MIRFLCPTCKAQLRAPDDKVGARTTCPGCKQRVQVPAASPTVERGPIIGEVMPSESSHQFPLAPRAFPQAPVPVRQETKACAFCGEMVLSIAKKCKHCGETIDVTLRAAEEAQ